MSTPSATTETYRLRRDVHAADLEALDAAVRQEPVQPMENLRVTGLAQDAKQSLRRAMAAGQNVDIGGQALRVRRERTSKLDSFYENIALHRQHNRQVRLNISLDHLAQYDLATLFAMTEFLNEHRATLKNPEILSTVLLAMRRGRTMDLQSLRNVFDMHAKLGESMTFPLGAEHLQKYQEHELTELYGFLHDRQVWLKNPHVLQLIRQALCDKKPAPVPERRSAFDWVVRRDAQAPAQRQAEREAAEYLGTNTGLRGLWNGFRRRLGFGQPALNAG